MDQFLCMYKLWFLRLALVSGGGPGTACIAAVSWGCDVLIDDEEAIAETVISYCKKDSIHCSHYTNGEDAIEYISHNHIDLLIVDWMLPGISGPEIIQKVRTFLDVPIIMMSSRDDQSDIVIGLDMGADDYITKPFGVRELMARIKVRLRAKTTKMIDEQDVTYGNLIFSFQKREMKKKANLECIKDDFVSFKKMFVP